MANAFLGDRFILDTADSALLLNTLAPGLPLPVKVRGIRVVGMTTNAHEAIIQDSNDAVLFHEKEATASLGITKECRIPMVWRKDFQVTTLDSGTVYVYLDV